MECGKLFSRAWRCLSRIALGKYFRVVKQLLTGHSRTQSTLHADFANPTKTTTPRSPHYIRHSCARKYFCFAYRTLRARLAKINLTASSRICHAETSRSDCVTTLAQYLPSDGEPVPLQPDHWSCYPPWHCADAGFHPGGPI